jgi:hypothetical protein
LFEPWEAREIACIYTFAKERYPPPWRKMTIITIGFISATNATLKALRFATQDVVGAINLGFHRRAVINQL